jgi:hypothetical protein
VIIEFCRVAVISYPDIPELNGPSLNEVYDHPGTSNISDTNNAAEVTDDNAIHELSQGDNPSHATNAFENAVDGPSVDNAIHELSQGDDPSHATNAFENAVDGPSVDLEGLAEPSIEFGSHFSDASTVVMEVFPFGKPGAPIPDMPQGPSLYERVQAIPGGSIWTPFQSKWDWDAARWAKTHSTTSSAVSDFLRIVCSSLFCCLFRR